MTGNINKQSWFSKFDPYSYEGFKELHFVKKGLVGLGVFLATIITFTFGTEDAFKTLISLIGRVSKETPEHSTEIHDVATPIINQTSTAAKEKVKEEEINAVKNPLYGLVKKGTKAEIKKEEQPADSHNSTSTKFADLGEKTIRQPDLSPEDIRGQEPVIGSLYKEEAVITIKTEEPKEDAITKQEAAANLAEVRARYAANYAQRDSQVKEEIYAEIDRIFVKLNTISSLDEKEKFLTDEMRKMKQGLPRIEDKKQGIGHEDLEHEIRVIQKAKQGLSWEMSKSKGFYEFLANDEEFDADDKKWIEEVIAEKKDEMAAEQEAKAVAEAEAQAKIEEAARAKVEAKAKAKAEAKAKAAAEANELFETLMASIEKATKEERRNLKYEIRNNSDMILTRQQRGDLIQAIKKQNKLDAEKVELEVKEMSRLYKSGEEFVARRLELGAEIDSHTIEHVKTSDLYTPEDKEMIIKAVENHMQKETKTAVVGTLEMNNQ